MTRQNSTEGPGQGPSREADALAQRLLAIVRALDGLRVGAGENELWFEPATAHGLQVRLGPDSLVRTFDRSANLSISYGAQPGDEGIPAAFGEVVARIKVLDQWPITGAAAVFRPAAQSVVRQIAHSQTPMTPADAARERQGITFLDLFAQLPGGGARDLRPLHWGFWAGDAAASGSEPTGYDPFDAFSDNLISYIPAAVSRILDVGCGLGCLEKLLSARNKRVTAVSPVAHHCAVVAGARLPGVRVQCARFEDLAQDETFNLLLFSESVNHFSLDEGFFARCRSLVGSPGFVLLADDLSVERRELIERQSMFRLNRVVDISANVAPTAAWWARRMALFAAYHGALMQTLEGEDPPLAARVREVLGALHHSELKVLLSGTLAPPAFKGRYVIYLLRSD